MRIRTKLIAAGTAAAGALALSTPVVAYAQDGDSLLGVGNDNNVAANVCGTDVNVIAEESSKTNCKNKINDANGGENGDSLVDVLNDNNVAANVCGTDVNVVAEESGKTNCKNKINEGKKKEAPEKEAPEKEAPEKEAPEEEVEEAVEEAPAAEAVEGVQPTFAG